MNFFRSIWNKIQFASQSDCNDDRTCTENENIRELLADVGYSRLEPRQVLSATFELAGTFLTLDSFDADQDLSFATQDVLIGNEMVEAYVFTIADGEWGGTVTGGIEVENNNTILEVNVLIVDQLLINGENNISLTQTSPFSVSNFAAQNFSQTDLSFSLDISGNVTLQNISVDDLDPMDGDDVQIQVNATASITVNGTLANLSTSAAAGISLTTAEAISDLRLEGATVSTAAGDLVFSAADEIVLTDDGPDSTNVSTGMSGNIFLVANSDGQAGDSGDGILIDDGSTITGDQGNIALIASGQNGGSITVSSVVTGGSITVNATGEILDGSDAELAIFVATSADLTGASIGVNGIGGEVELDVSKSHFQRNRTCTNN